MAEPGMSEKLPPWVKKARNWGLAMGALVATGTAGTMVRPVLEWTFTYDLRKRVADNALNIYSKTAMIETRLANIENILQTRDEVRDKELLEMAFKVWNQRNPELARTP